MVLICAENRLEDRKPLVDLVFRNRERRHEADGVRTRRQREESAFHDECRKVYRARLERGVAREQARKDLPLSTYTEAYWKCNLHNLLHFLALRMEAGAQLEIRDYATTIGREIVSRWVPFAWKAFTDYALEATALSRHERTLLGMIARGETDPARTYATANGLVRDGKPGREIRELEGKLADMGIQSPWS